MWTKLKLTWGKAPSVLRTQDDRDGATRGSPKQRNERRGATAERSSGALFGGSKPAERETRRGGQGNGKGGWAVVVREFYSHIPSPYRPIPTRSPATSSLSLRSTDMQPHLSISPLSFVPTAPWPHLSISTASFATRSCPRHLR